MKTVNIELEDSMEGPSMPSGPGKPCYPCFSFTLDEDPNLPDSGRMVIEYIKRRSTEEIQDDGDKQYRCTIDVCCIEGVEADKTTINAQKDDGEDNASALDKLRDAKMKESY